MKRVDGILIEDISTDDIVFEPALKKVKRYEELSKLWKTIFFVFLISIVANYFITIFFDEKFEGGFASTRLGIFLLLFLTITFIAFGVSYISEKRFLKNKWQCPSCKEKYPYFSGPKECKGKYFLMDCNTLGIRLAAVEKTPLIMPHKCPNCKERLWKESKNG